MQKKLLIMLSVIFVMLTTFAYSALSTSLAITSEVELRPLADIRVTGISLSATDGATVQYESEYSKDTITSGFILPTSNASISYTVRIDNAGDVDYAIYDILKTSCSDTGLTYSVSGYNIGDVIPARTTLNMVITYTTTTPSNNVIAIVNTMDFRKVFYVSYNTGTSQTISQQTKYENIPLTLTSTVPTRNGYTFANWNTNPNGTGVNYNSGASYTLDESKILYAIWNITNYNITYSLKNGVVSSANPSTYNVESSSITLTNPTKTLTFVGNYNTTAGAKADSNSGVVIGNNTTSNQTFAGWSGTDLNNNTTTVTIPTGSYGDRSYTAHWTAVAGNTPTVTRDGYTCGWNTSENGTTIQISSGGSYATSRITEDMNATVNLYAVCTPNTYNISYTLNNGTVSGTNPTSYTPESSSITLINPTKTLTFHGNYNSSSSSNANSGSGVQIGSNTSGAQEFAGWSGTGLANNTTTVTIPTGSYGDRSYTAHWTATGVTLPTVTRTGYTCGWNKTNRATTITYASGGTYPTSEITESMSTSTINLYAVCTRVTYTIAYEMNGGPNPSTKPTTGTYNSSVNITNPNSKTFTVNINANSQNATIGSNSVSATQTFAGWTSTTIGPNAKTGTSSSTQNTAWDGSLTTRRYFRNLRDDDGTVTMVANWNNANATLPTITKTGSTCGYATEPDGAIVYNSGASYATDTSTNSVTLYAKCSAATYTVQYCQGNNSTTAGYSCSQNTSTHTYDVVSSLNSYASSGLTAPTGWTFAGWNTSSTGTGVTYTDEENVTNLSSSSGTVNLYAVFKKQFNAISGVSGATNTTLWQYYNPYRTTGYLTSITLPSLTSITNWSALGYRLDTTANSSTQSTGSTTPAYNATNTTYYGVYSRNLIITYAGNTATGSTSSTTKTIYMNTNQTTTSSQEVTLANNGFTKTGYAFNKWAEASTSGTQYSEGATYNPNLAYNSSTFGTTMYALWNAITYTVQYCVGNNSTTAGYTCSSTTSTHTYDTAQNLTSYSTLGLSTPTGWTFYGWTTDGTGSYSRDYEDQSSVVNLSNTQGSTVNLYAVYKRTINCHSGINRQQNSTLTQYYNPYKTDKISSITMPTPRAITNWTALGFRTDTTASTATYVAGASVTPAYNETPVYYAVYSRDLTITYDANGSTGSTSNTVKAVYMNTNQTTTSSQEVTLAYNNFDVTQAAFAGWAEGSGSGAVYNQGATYNPNLAYNAATFGTTMYALWDAANYSVGNNLYLTLADALLGCNTTGSTIVLLDDYYDPSVVNISSSSITSVTLDLYGSILTRDDDITVGSGVTLNLSGANGVGAIGFEPGATGKFVNNGTVVADGVGIYGQSNSNAIVVNNGTFTLYNNESYSTENVSITNNDDYEVLYNAQGATFNMYEHTGLYGYATGDGKGMVYNAGTFNMYGGDIYNPNSPDEDATTYVIKNYGTGIVNLDCASYAYGETEGDIETPGSIAVANLGNGTINMEGVFISSYIGVINETNAGTINVTGGIIDAYEYGIAHNGGSITIGDSSSPVSYNEPVIHGMTGIGRIGGNSTVSFYSGVIYSDTAASAIDGSYVIRSGYTLIQEPYDGQYLTYLGLPYTVQFCQGNNSTTAGYTCSSTTQTHVVDVYRELTSYSSLGLTAPTGWTFAGWSTSPTSTDREYSDNDYVTNLSNTSGTTVSLYAVFKKDFYIKSGVNKATSNSTTQYYNPYRTTGYLTSITLPSLTSITNWSSLGYRLDTTADAATISTGIKTPLYDQSATTYYATYSRELTITYNGNNNDGGSTSNTTKTIYMNTNQTTTSSQEVTLANNGFTKTSYTFNKWAEGSTSGTQYSEGVSYNPNLAYNAATFGTTMYALWIPTTYTVQYCVGNNSTTAGYTCSSTTSTHSVDIAQNLTSYSTLGLSTPTGWTFAGWNTSPSGTAATYTDGVSVVNLSSTGGDTVNLYAVYKKDLRLYGGRPSGSTTRTQYYNPYTISTLSSITLNVSTQIPNWTVIGYRTDTTAGEATYSLGQQVTPAYDETPSYYEVYTRDLTIQYNGNGNTGGSVNGIIKPIYLNAYSNTTSSQEVTLATNTITKTGYSFVDWTEGSTSGTHYNAGATYNPDLAYNAASFDIVMYANWLGMYHNIVWDYNYQTSSLISYVSTAQFTFTNNTSSSYPGEKTARGGIAISFAGSSGNRPQAKTNATYSLTAGKTYTLSLFARTNLSAAGQDIAYGISDSSSATTFVCDGISNTYKRCSTTFTVEDTGDYNVFVNSNDSLSATTTIYFHSLDLSEVSAANGLEYDDYNKTMTFDGVDDWWNMGVRNSNPQSLDVTFVTGNTAPTNNYILGNWQTGGGGILISGSGYICGNYYITEEATYKSVCTTYKAQANTEYHVALTYDGATMKLYVNGEFYKSLNVTGTIGVPGSSTVMSLGSNPAGTSGGEDFFKGTIKGARVYNAVKSAEDIRKNYLFDKGNDVEGCVAASGLVYSITRYDVVGINRSIWSRRANEAIGSVASASRSGYTFDGWWTDPVGGTQVTVDTIMPDSNITVYAHWKYNMTLNFWPNGGTVSPTSKTVFYNEPRGELPTPTKSGYYFGGWGWNGVPTGTNGYTTLTYITGDGSHYIDTGHYTTPNTGIYMDYQFDDASVLQQRLFSVNNNNPSSLYYEMYINGSGKLAYAYEDNDGNWISTGVAADTSRRVIRFNVNNTKKILIDTTSTSNGSIYNGNILGSPTLTSNITMKVFTHGRVGSKAKAKLYAFKIYENGTLVSDMVPVRRNSDNVEGLYDKYQQKFHTWDHTIELTNTYIKTAVENEPYSGSETLYARWLTTPFNSTVSYNCTQTGGSGSIASETVAINGAIDLTKTCTPPSGFTHIGWNKSSTAKEALPSLEMGTSDITLYAIYRSSSEYSATFNLQDDIGITMTGGNTSCYRYNGASSCSITAPTIVANAGNGTTIVGWSETANTHSATYSNGANISINSNKTYYSITQRTFNVNFVRNSHVTGIGSADQDQSIPCTIWNNESACSVTSPSTIIVDSGYKANGFNTDANATTSTWNANSTKNIRVPTTYYGIAKGIDYSVKFNANCPSGVTPTGSMSNQSMVYGTSSNLSANEFSCSGYSFLKWTTNQDGTGNSYNNEQSVNNLTTTENATVNLYAQWGQLWAENIAYDNTNTGVNCTDTQCMLDYLSSLYATPTSFANDSWFTIAKTVRENPTFYPVGATKTISMDIDGNGTPETYTLRVANNTTPAECSTQGFSQTACGFVVEFLDVITWHRMNLAVNGSDIGTGNIGGWESSDMRAFINSTVYTAGNIDYSSTGIYDKLPSALKNNIISTTVVSGYGANDSANFVTTDKLYLLDGKEIYGTSYTKQNNKAKGNERQLDYYLLQGVTTSNYSDAVKKLNGSANYWWLRSANFEGNNSFYFVHTNGSENSYYSYYDRGVSPAFRIG